MVIEAVSKTTFLCEGWFYFNKKGIKKERNCVDSPARESQNFRT